MASARAGPAKPIPATADSPAKIAAAMRAVRTNMRPRLPLLLTLLDRWQRMRPRGERHRDWEIPAVNPPGTCQPNDSGDPTDLPDARLRASLTPEPSAT